MVKIKSAVSVIDSEAIKSELAPWFIMSWTEEEYKRKAAYFSFPQRQLQQTNQTNESTHPQKPATLLKSNAFNLIITVD